MLHREGGVGGGGHVHSGLGRSKGGGGRALL